MAQNNTNEFKPKYEEIILFGLGGIGSWMANFITRQGLTKEITLIDFDHVEEKNFSRQDYNTRVLGSQKTNATEYLIKRIQPEGKLPIIHKTDKQIKDEADIIAMNPSTLCIIATDNVKSKQLLAKHFKNFLLINCDKNHIEIKNYLDKEEKVAWDLGGGYDNEQNLTSNITACIHAIKIITDHNPGEYGRFSYKFQPETHISELISNNRK